MQNIFTQNIIHKLPFSLQGISSIVNAVSIGLLFVAKSDSIGSKYKMTIQKAKDIDHYKKRLLALSPKTLKKIKAVIGVLDDYVSICEYASEFPCDVESAKFKNEELGLSFVDSEHILTMFFNEFEILPIPKEGDISQDLKQKEFIILDLVPLTGVAKHEHYLKKFQEHYDIPFEENYDNFKKALEKSIFILEHNLSAKEEEVLEFKNLLTFNLNTNLAKYKRNKPARFSPDKDAHKLLKNFMENPCHLFSYKQLYQVIEKPISGVVTAIEKTQMREKIRNICTRLGIENLNDLFVCEGGYSLGEYKS